MCAPIHGQYLITDNCYNAEVAELVDALASGASGLRAVEVQVFSSAPLK